VHFVLVQLAQFSKKIESDPKHQEPAEAVGQWHEQLAQEIAIQKAH